MLGNYFPSELFPLYPILHMIGSPSSTGLALLKTSISDCRSNKNHPCPKTPHLRAYYIIFDLKLSVTLN